MVVDLQKSDIEKFQKLYKKHFNKDIDYETAYRELSKLVRQMELVYQPITRQQLEKGFQKPNTHKPK
jgi:hypothetical protein